MVSQSRSSDGGVPKGDLETREPEGESVARSAVIRMFSRFRGVEKEEGREGEGLKIVVVKRGPFGVFWME